MMINKEIKRHCNRLDINEGIILLNFMTDQICVKIREFLNIFSTMIHIIQNKMPSIYREQNWIPVPIHSENRYRITLQVFVLWARANYRFIVLNG